VPDNISRKNPDLNAIFENLFVRTLLTSVLMAIFLVDMSLGLYGFFTTKTSPLPSSAFFLIFALVFIAGLVFYEKQGFEPQIVLLGGSVAGVGFAFVFAFLVGGFQFIFRGGLSNLGLEPVLSAIAGSMIVSVVLLKILSYKFHDIVF